jgi:hypothetical protein
MTESLFSPYTIKSTNIQPTNSIVFNTKNTKEIVKFTEEGFYYKGQFVDDAGEVHRLLKDVLYEMSAYGWIANCKRLLQAIDSGNKEAEELVLCQIRTALNEIND